jgi:regulator of replication initiation timing
MNEHHDTNQTYDSCKYCEELAKEVMRVVRERNNLSDHNRSLIKDLKETRGQVAELYANNSALRFGNSEMGNRIRDLTQQCEYWKSLYKALEKYTEDPYQSLENYKEWQILKQKQPYHKI